MKSIASYLDVSRQTVHAIPKCFAEEQEEKLSCSSVEWQPDDRHLAHVGNPRFYHSPQLELWETGSVEWFVIIRTDPPGRRCSRCGRVVIVQLPLQSEGTQG